ncbi:hypothetical protein EZS27_031454, partial [termite gut metagenome]
MSKRVDTSGLDTKFIIGQTDKSNREAKPNPVPPQAVEPMATEIEPVTVPVVSPPATEPEYEPEPLREVKESPKRRRAQAAGYKETF